MNARLAADGVSKGDYVKEQLACTRMTWSSAASTELPMQASVNARFLPRCSVAKSRALSSAWCVRETWCDDSRRACPVT
jgi:hypothetical protein